MAESKFQFERLTPNDSIDLDVYDEAIRYVFENSDIKNVAISGAYSAGKSSVLASYKKKHPDLRFLHISLAHFMSPDQENETDVKESVLEGKILNQLIHQIPSEKIPQTNFRIKKRVETKGVITRTVGAVLLLIALIYFIQFDSWKNYVNSLPDNWLRSALLPSTHQYALLADGIIIAGLLSLMVYGLIRVQKNKNVFRKLNLQGNEIEIFEESDESYFDKYLNEVLYLFENADADVIVFEDMDRFNVNRVFERLREVNTLVNIQLQKENKNVLRFFYLLRDDIFVSKDRTKFFDYIIPVVPVVDSSNSFDLFISQFQKSGLFEKFNESFLQGLSLYVDDMRLLKNIYNEFIIYYNRLNITELDCNKMLAMITYKNLFPRDYADLQLNRGFVYTLFNSKERFIAEELESLSTQISDKAHDIEQARNELLKTIKELDAEFEDKKTTTLLGRKKTLSEAAQKEYDERKQAIETRLNRQISALEDEKSALERQRVLTQSKPLRDLITRENINRIFNITVKNEIGETIDFKDVKSNEYFDLLKYLIRNGYLDETYADYMTYFYENSLSRTDKIFLRSITDKKAKDYTYPLKNPSLIVSHLRLVDFDQEEILNFDLLTYLLHTSSHTEYIERWIDQLRNTRNFKFMAAYYAVTTELPAYMKFLNKQWPDAFSTAFSEDALTEKQLHQYSIDSIYYSDDAVLELMDRDHCLRDYISKKRDYLAIEHPDIDRLIHCFQLLGVRFAGMDYAESDQSLFRAVYEESLYKINSANLQLMQEKILGIKNKDDILHRNYTILSFNPDAAMTKYVNQHIKEYLDAVIQICDGVIRDDEDIAISVLNNHDLSKEYKCTYISALQTNIVSIDDIIDKDLWVPLLNANIVQYSERNLMDCFKALELHESVIAYINRYDIDFAFPETELDRESQKSLFLAVGRCTAIENAKYEKLLLSLNFHYVGFDVLNLTKTKLAILINAGIIQMTPQNLKFIREHYPNQKFHFIYKNIEQYTKIMEPALFSQDELLKILNWHTSDNFKTNLLQFTSEKISIIQKNYSPAVRLHILTNNFMQSDLPALYASYEQWDSSVQAKIFQYAANNLTYIIANQHSVSRKLKHAVLRSDIVERAQKIDLFIAMMPDLHVRGIKEILNILNLTDYLRIFDMHSEPTFEINEENEKLLSAFKDRNLIFHYEKSTKEEACYQIIRHPSYNHHSSQEKSD